MFEILHLLLFLACITNSDWCRHQEMALNVDMEFYDYDLGIFN